MDESAYLYAFEVAPGRLYTVLSPAGAMLRAVGADEADKHLAQGTQIVFSNDKTFVAINPPDAKKHQIVSQTIPPGSQLQLLLAEPTTVGVGYAYRTLRPLV